MENLVFHRVSIYQGQTLTLVYPWYNNIEHNRMQDKMNALLGISQLLNQSSGFSNLSCWLYSFYFSDNWLEIVNPGFLWPSPATRQSLSSCISTEPLLIGSSWSPYPCSFVWRGQQEYITYCCVLVSEHK